MKRLGGLISRLNRGAIWLGIVVLLLMIVNVSADVGLRFLFNSPLPGTILFVTVVFMIPIVFLPLAAIEEGDGHITVELIYDYLARPLQWLLRLLSYVISIAVFSLLAIRTGQEAVRKFEIAAFAMEAGIRIPTWPSYFVLPVGFGLILLVLVYKLVCHLTANPSSFDQFTEDNAAEDIENLRRGGD